MQTQKTIGEIWHQHSSGLLTLGGTHSDLSLRSFETYLQVKEKAKDVEQLYRENGVSLPPGCDLGRLVANAKAISDLWFLNSPTKISTPMLFGLLHFSRIADAVLPLRKTPECARFLSTLASGNLDLLQRHKSLAKSALWELELWAGLRGRSFDVSLAEPDIVANFGCTKVALACKKLYSAKHVQHVLSQAVLQIESTIEFGIAALNIDDLLPPNLVLRVPSIEVAERVVTEINNSFIVRHDRHFRKYLASGRLLSALVSTAVVADITGSACRLHNIRRSTIWTIPGLPAEKDAQLRRFYDQMMG